MHSCQHAHTHALLARRVSAALIPVLTSLFLAACGGGSSSTTAGTGSSSAASSNTSVASTLDGTVAVGAPITNGKLRVLDANGDVVAENVTIDADGSYAGITLTGPAPYRIEACGYAGADYVCLHSVVQGPGTGNVTPLTEAVVLLATGEQPGDVMSNGSANLDTTHVTAAMDNLRNSLGSVLTDADVGSSFNFIDGTLDAGSRTGYDRVLDAVGVSTGVDQNPFVQITPRMGSGNVYIESGSAASGSITVDSSAATVSLSGIETLFHNMTTAIASESACSNGLATYISPNAHMSMGDGPLDGAAQVASGICQYFGSGGEGGDGPMWGAQFVSPRLGRCDFSGAQPVCRVTFAIKSPEGDINNVGNGMGAELFGSTWKFLGDVDPISIHANATAQRDRRVAADGSTLGDTYARALQFDIERVAGLQCVKLEQPDANGAMTLVGFYKLYDNSAPRMSLWVDNNSARSLDPLNGMLRSADDTWITLPQGTEGDTVVRNFFRGGRTVLASLYGDANCTQPFSANGHTTLEVDVEGVPPVWAAMDAQSWAELSPAAITDMIALDVPTTGTHTYVGNFSYAHGSIGMNDASLCASRDCGQGSGGRVAETSMRAGATSVTFNIDHPATALTPTGFKMIALYGRGADGLALQTNVIFCPASQNGQQCQ